MKSFHVISIILLCAGVPASAQWMSISGPEGSPVAANVLEDKTSETVIEFNVAGYNQTSIDIDSSPYVTLSVPDAPIFLEKGYPELPRLNRSIVIPDEARMKVEIVEAEYDTVYGALIAPSKGPLSLSIDPQTVPYTFSGFYKTDTFWPEKPVELSQPFLIRDMRGITVQFNLFRHNAVKKQLIVCKRLVARVYADGMDDVNVNRNRRAKLDRDFKRLYQRFFLNFSENNVSSLGKAAYNDIDETGRMLIIAADDFYDRMIPLRDWRTRKKHKTTLVKCSDVGTTASAVQSYIQNMYNSQSSVTYILLVGDGTNIPSKGIPYPGGYLNPQDPTYTYLNDDPGTTEYPDAYISRLSAENVTQVENQVRRIIKYETNPATGAWFKKASGIASYETLNVFPDVYYCSLLRSDLLGYGYTSVDEFYGYDAEPSVIMNALDTGRGVVNYIGHGTAEGGWHFNYPEYREVFKFEDVGLLSNANYLPFVFSVACEVGSFSDYSTCFAEAWLRSGTASNPKGAIGFYGSSTEQDIKAPHVAIVEAVDLLVANAKISMGGLCFNASCKMIEEYPQSAGPNTFNAWHIFGDAATNIWTNTPYEIPASYVTVNDYGSSIRVQTYGTWDICVSSGNNGASFHKFVEEDNNEIFTTTVRPLYITVSDHNVIPNTVVTGGTFSSNETWCGNIFVRGDVTVASGYTLTVTPGTKVTFATTDDQSGGLSSSKCEIIVNGTLKADEATFTCPTQGAWYGIRFTSSGTNNSYLKNCTIKNAYNGVDIDGKNPQVQKCFIDDALNYGIYIKGNAWPYIYDNYIEGGYAGVYHNGGNGYFQNNSFRNSQYGVYVISASPLYDYYNWGRNKFESSISKDKARVQSGQPILSDYQYFTIPNSGYKYISNGSSYTILATYNYWSAYPPSSTYFSGSVDRSNPLSSPPSPPAGPDWSLPKTSGEEFFVAFDQARLLFYEGKYSEAEEDFMKLAEEYKSLEESSYAVNWAMLASEQLGKLESQEEYLESVKNDKSFHEAARFYALKWLVQKELRSGSVEKALKLASEVAPGSVFDREISLDLATGLFYYQDDKKKAEEVLDKLSRKFADESTAEAVGLLKEGFVKDVITDNPNIETAETVENEPIFSAFPTPFNAATKICYRLVEDGRVSVVIYNILGQQVLRLVDEKMPAGTYEVIWDGTNAYGMIVPSGMYLCRLETPNKAKTIKLLMTK